MFRILILLLCAVDFGVKFGKCGTTCPNKHPLHDATKCLRYGEKTPDCYAWYEYR